MIQSEIDSYNVRFGFLLSGQYQVGTDLVARLDEHLEQTRLACEQGFAGVFYTEHFLTPTLVRPHQLTFLARVAAEAGKMHVGTALTLLPLKNPVELADMAATLDHITHGRFILGLGLGYREIEYKAFGLTKAMAVAVFEERLAILKRLWSEDEITYQGHGFTLEKATCTLRPVQKPHPPIWIGANNEGAIRRTATHGDVWLINPHGRLDVLTEQIRIYHEAREARGLPKPDMLPLIREVFVAETRTRAEELARPALEQKYKTYVAVGQHRAMPHSDTLDLPLTQLRLHRFIIGNPDDVIRGLQTCIERLGVNYIIVRMQWPGLEHKYTAQAIKLMGKYVIPCFRPDAAEGIAIEQCSSLGRQASRKDSA